jgi:hypothetical protein
MAKTLRKVTMALAVSAALLTARAATAADAPERATIVLHVDNFANLLPDHLNDAEKVARRIYAMAGIQTLWRHGREEAPTVEGAIQLKVLLLSREMGERKIAADRVGATVLGQAAKGCGRAYIFTHRVAALAARNRLYLADVLGRVIAHELGHLMLPENSHSATGIMMAGLDMRANADATFTPDQVVAIRQTLASGN